MKSCVKQTVQNLREPMKAADLLKRPEINYNQIARIVPPEEKISEEVEEQVEIFIKYEGYIEKSMQQVEKMKKMENKKIPDNIDYNAISGIATEAKSMLNEVRPLSIAQASRISGVNPADISILLVYIEQGRIAKVSSLSDKHLASSSSAECWRHNCIIRIRVFL